jgi:hypothetical protein
MATLIIKSNAAQGTDVTIADVGVIIPNSGGTETFIENDELYELQASQDLRDYLQDDVHGASSSTLILNDGTSDIAQSDIDNFLDSLVLPEGDADFGVIKNNAAGQVATNLTFNGTATVTGLPSFPVNGSDAVSKTYVDLLTTSNRTFKELLLSCVQLDSVNDSISNAVPFWFLNNPANADTLTLTDGSTSETFTFLASPAASFDVQIGATAADTMENLATTLNTDSTAWKGLYTTDLGQLNTGVVVIYRANYATTSQDRIFGSFTTAADVRQVNYNGENDYSRSTATAIPTSDPGVRTFGFGRTTSTLSPSQTHVCRDDDTLYTWDSDDGEWQNTGTNSPLLQDSRYVGKWIHFGMSLAVPSNGTRFLQGPGNVTTSAAGILLPRTGQITGATLVADVADAVRAHKLSIRLNGTEVGLLNLSASNTSAFTTALSLAVSSGDILSLAIIRTSGTADKSTFKNVAVTIELNETVS